MKCFCHIHGKESSDIMEVSEIAKVHEVGQSHWSNLQLSIEALTSCSGTWQTSSPLSPSIAKDLYLACACALSIEGAADAFHTRHRGDIDKAMRPMALPSDLQSEIRQAVMTKLLVANPGVPQIQKYSGRGSLAGWVRAVTARAAIDILRKEKSDEIVVDTPVLEALAEADFDPDLRAIKAQHRSLVNQAFEVGFRQLTVRQRNILRQHYIHQLNIDKLGIMYKVHRATAFRWVAQARADVFSSARAHVATALGERRDTAEELLHLLQSQVDVSLDRLLRSQNEDAI